MALFLGSMNQFRLHRSEVDDINLGLEHFYGDFNVVHAWLVGSGVSFTSFVFSMCRFQSTF